MTLLAQADAGPKETCPSEALETAFGLFHSRMPQRNLRPSFWTTMTSSQSVSQAASPRRLSLPPALQSECASRFSESCPHGSQAPRRAWRSGVYIFSLWKQWHHPTYSHLPVFNTIQFRYMKSIGSVSWLENRSLSVNPSIHFDTWRSLTFQK